MTTLLATNVAGIQFQNPIILAAGTAAFGREISGVVDIEALGGLVTKAVSTDVRHGNRSPRLAEYRGGMINAVGLANPGLKGVIEGELPWLAANLKKARALLNVVGNSIEDFVEIVTSIDKCVSASGVAGYELNVSCPNVKAGGLEFGADPAALEQLVSRVRAATLKPLFVKLSPTLIAQIGETAKVAEGAGADAISVINTMPGLLVDVDSRKPRIGFGSGGVSGKGLLPVGILATWRVSRAVKIPVLGLGGVETAEDALQYLMAGASLVGVGTAAMRDPRAPGRIVSDLHHWLERKSVKSISDIVGSLEWPS